MENIGANQNQRAAARRQLNKGLFAGRRVACAKSGSAFTTPDTYAYLYNVRSELTNATAEVDAAYRYGYDFDDIGNRESSSERGTNSVYTANQLNQYTEISDSALSASPCEIFTPQFDDDGNQTLIKTATGIWSVTYNGENRPILWENVAPNSSTQNSSTRSLISMSYDRMGRRVTKSNQRFVYTSYLPIANLEYQTSNIKHQTFIWDPTELVATRPLVWNRSGDFAYYVFDGNKNVSEAIASNNDVSAHYEYAPFGALIVSRGTSAATNPFRFSSEYAEDDTATVYYNYRHYEPVMGRWLGRDPIEERGGFQLYCFCRNAFGYDYCGMNWTDWQKRLLPDWVFILMQAKDCLVTMYNWSVNMKQHCDTSADGAYADKFLHCYASCEFSQDCGTKVSAALGVIKEIGDIIGHTLGLFKDLLFEDRSTVGEDFEWYWKWIVDGGTDLWADGFGIACSWAGENCKCCCEKKYDKFHN